jgi:hypothetical protein
MLIHILPDILLSVILTQFFVIKKFSESITNLSQATRLVSTIIFSQVVIFFTTIGPLQSDIASNSNLTGVEV